MPERGSKTSTVPIVWATFGILSARSKRFPVAIGDHGRNLVISLWHGDKAYIAMTRRQSKYRYDTETKQKSVEWRHNGSTRPKKFRVHNPLEKFSASIFFGGSRRYPPNWLPSKGQNYQRGVLIISAGAIEGHFEGKTPPREGHKGGHVFARQCPGSPGTCNPEETGLPGLPISWSPTLFSGSGPSDYHLFPGLKKIIERSPFFVRRGVHCCRWHLVGRTIFWIFWVAYKS